MSVRYSALITVAAIGMAAVLTAPLARADVVVSGTPAAIDVVATRSTVREVLQRLSASYALDLHGEGDLSEPISGNFKGSLRAIVEQVLGSHDHIMFPDGQKLAVFVIASPTATPPHPVATANAAAAAEPVASDPALAQTEQRKPTLSPEGQRMAVKMFGEKGRYLQVDETLLRSFATGRGGRRFVQPAP